MLGFAPVASFPVASDPYGTVYAVTLNEVAHIADHVQAGTVFFVVIDEVLGALDVIRGFVVGPPSPVAKLIARGRLLTVDPRYLTCERWTTLTAQALLEIGYVPRSATEEDWRQWAQYVRGLTILSALQIPDPRFYNDWREWAFQYNHAIYIGTW